MLQNFSFLTGLLYELPISAWNIDKEKEEKERNEIKFKETEKNRFLPVLQDRENLHQFQTTGISYFVYKKMNYYFYLIQPELND